ncbi:hypothetical protein [Sorangium cellulosum]|uniref:hypothetical protein n=1 Tax=Sorangium cellulosum TaxID=56 RepID=UPI0012DB3B67|nr:hypothetical protein [Sorangium cellulosum]
MLIDRAIPETGAAGIQQRSTRWGLELHCGVVREEARRKAERAARSLEGRAAVKKKSSSPEVRAEGRRRRAGAP